MLRKLTLEEMRSLNKDADISDAFSTYFIAWIGLKLIIIVLILVLQLIFIKKMNCSH